MSKRKNIYCYFIIAFSVIVSLCDIYYTVLTVDTIHMDEINPIAKRIILYGKESLNYQGIALLVLIKSTLLCLISVGISIFHYSKNELLHKIVFIVGSIYFIESILLLGILLW